MDPRNKVGTILLALFSALLLLSSPATASAAFPCEDANNNGVCDPGEKDITAQVLNGGFQTQESIVIPPGVVGLSNSKGFNLVAGKNIIIDSDLTALSPWTYVQLNAGGVIDIGTGVDIQSAEIVSMNAGGDIVLGPGSSFFAGKYCVAVYSRAGKVQIEEGATLSASKYLSLYGKDIAIAGAHLKSNMIYAITLGTGKIAINDTTLQAYMAYVYAVQGSMIDFRNNRLEMTGYNGQAGQGVAYLLAYGADSTLDIRGTAFINASYVMKKADHVIQ